MRPDELMSDEEMTRIQCLAYVAAHVVLAVRRDPSRKQPVDEEELGLLLLGLADQVVEEHKAVFDKADLLTVLPLMRGVWEADKQVGAEIGVW